MVIRHPILMAALAAATTFATAGCGVLDGARTAVGAGPGQKRAGRICFVVDTTYSGAVNGRVYLSVIEQELRNVESPTGPAEVCVVNVTGNPSVSSSVQRFPLVSHAATADGRVTAVNDALRQLLATLVSPYRNPPPCLHRSGRAITDAGGARMARLSDPSHASAVFETFVLASRAEHLAPGDRIIGLTDGIERRGAVNLVATPLLGASQAQPAGRLAVFRRIVEQGGAPRGALRGIRVELPAPGSPVCGAPYSDTRGSQIEKLWTQDWAQRTGAQVSWT